MGILWFGGAKKLDDLKVKDLRKERTRQEVEQDQLIARIRRAGSEVDGYLDAASEPGTTNAEVEVAAYKMDRASRRKSKAESNLQNVITRIQVVDSTIDILEQRKELEKRGIWKVISDMDEDRLQEQLERFAFERKESHLGVNKIAEMLEIDEMDVKASRSPGFRKAREAILTAKTSREEWRNDR
jgi:hypothetical protein